jgi:predicted 3-demethylubiquinone-9 3-methyltransferase (glyoxalase superfamily)
MNSQKVIPFLTFHGNAEEAMKFYVTAFPGAKIESLIHFEKDQRGDEGKVLTGVLSFMGQQIMFMDMEATLDLPKFTWSTSFYLGCEDDAEFDTIFNALADGGFVMMGPEPVLEFRKVAWVIDKFGVTWQPALKGN